jgi:hypothetical protein
MEGNAGMLWFHDGIFGQDEMVVNGCNAMATLKKSKKE